MKNQYIGSNCLGHTGIDWLGQFADLRRVWQKRMHTMDHAEK